MTIDRARNPRHDLSDRAFRPASSLARQSGAPLTIILGSIATGHCGASSADDAGRCWQAGDHGAPPAAAL